MHNSIIFYIYIYVFLSLLINFLEKKNKFVSVILCLYSLVFAVYHFDGSRVNRVRVVNEDAIHCVHSHVSRCCHRNESNSNIPYGTRLWCNDLWLPLCHHDKRQQIVDIVSALRCIFSMTVFLQWNANKKSVEKWVRIWAAWEQG